jgi:hypothetical protein
MTLQFAGIILCIRSLSMVQQSIKIQNKTIGFKIPRIQRNNHIFDMIVGICIRETFIFMIKMKKTTT